MTTDKIDTYLDMNYYFSQGILKNDNLKNILSNCSQYQGMVTLEDDPALKNFYDETFTKSNLFKILFTDDLDNTCSSLHHYIVSPSLADITNAPSSFRYKYNAYYIQNGLNYLGDEGEELFLEHEEDISLVEILRDSKKFTYQTDETITELPIDVETFQTEYVDVYDTYPILSQLIIIELFYLHYKLEDDFVKYDVLMNIMNQLRTLETDVTYNLTCMLYAYVVLGKIMGSKLNISSAEYPADYWSNN